jgi:hypothetical protein
MPTHMTKCVVCQKDVACCGDSHALGCGGSQGKGGCNNPPYIEFCSIECALELQRRLVDSIENYREVVGEKR